MAALSNTQQLMFSTADRDVFIYDVGGGKFERKYHVIGFTNAITCLDYWFNYDNLNQSGMVFGDTDGGVMVFQFTETLKKGLFPKQEISDKGLTDLRNLKKRQQEKQAFLGFHYTYFSQLHTDWVRQVGIKFEKILCTIRFNFGSPETITFPTLILGNVSRNGPRSSVYDFLLSYGQKLYACQRAPGYSIVSEYPSRLK